MRNFNVFTSGYKEEWPETDVKCIYKEVVIIGNGPSGITLSYLLNGYRPYYNRIPHPDPMLSARLIECTQKSLIHQDLSFLSQGIEGRSKNPISLLIDAMTHPGADMGLEWPSLIAWKKTAKVLDHIVLGKGEPGGVWPEIADHVFTISPGRWMALPGLDFKEYHDKRAPAFEVARYYKEYIKKHDLTPYITSSTTVTAVQPLVSKIRKRARWKVRVTDATGETIFYECRHLVLATGSSDKAGSLGVPGESLPFVTHNLKHFEEQLSRGREKNIYISSVVNPSSSVHRKSVCLKCKSFMPTKESNNSCSIPKQSLEQEVDFTRRMVKHSKEGSWIGKKSEVLNNRSDHYSFECSDDVSDDQISVKCIEDVYEEEDEKGLCVTNSIPNEKEIGVCLSVLDLGSEDYMRVKKEVVKNESPQVLIVGAGLSAADAILTAWRNNYSVVHAFRSSLTATKLPAVMYPEYHELYRLMQGSSSRNDYMPLPEYQVTEFFEDNTVQLSDSSGNVKRLEVYSIAILIGSQPDLFFLPKTLKDLGIDPNKPVDCKVNPVQIDPFSYKCVRAPPGLYALGPLVGDNFVRFLQGGAVAIAGHIFKDNNLHRGL